MINNSFANQVKNLTEEIRNLKTSKPYTSIVPAGTYRSDGPLSGGVYMVTFAAGNSPVLSIIRGGDIGEGLVSVCAPQDDTQLFWIRSDASYSVDIIANRPILSVQKVS